MPCRSVAVEDGQPEQAPFICQIDDAVLEAAERDVAAVLGDRRAHPRLDQLLDGGDGLGVLGLEELRRLGPAPFRSRTSGAPDMKCSMMAPRIAGLSCCHSPSALVTVMKSQPKNTPVTPGISNRRSASGDCAAPRPVGNVERAVASTARPGRNFRSPGSGSARSG